MKLLGIKIYQNKRGNSSAILYVGQTSDGVQGLVCSSLYAPFDSVSPDVKIGDNIRVEYGQAYLYNGKLVQPIISVSSIKG